MIWTLKLIGQVEVNAVTVPCLASAVTPSHLPVWLWTQQPPVWQHLDSHQSIQRRLSGVRNVYSAVCPFVTSLPFRQDLNKASVVYMGHEPLYLK